MLVSQPSQCDETSRLPVSDEAVVEQQRKMAANGDLAEGGKDKHTDPAGQDQDEQHTAEMGVETDRPPDDCSNAVGDQSSGIPASETARSRRSSTPSYSRRLRRKQDEARLRGHEEEQCPVNRFEDWKAL